MDTTAGHFRSGYGRCGVGSNASGGLLKSTLYPGGAVTTAWLSGRVYTPSAFNTSTLFLGVGLSGTNSGLFVGTNSTTSNKVSLLKYDGTTKTVLASEPGTSLVINFLHRVDMQITSYGASATVNVYLDGTLLITFTGNVTVSGMSNFDSVFVSRFTNATVVSEVIVADEDSRSFSLVTMAPNANGTTQQWTGAVTDVNPTTINDANANFTNTAAQDQQYNLIDLPAGAFNIKACKIAARAMHTSGSTATGVQLGVNSGGTVNVGSTNSLTTAFTTYERYLATNPVSGVNWVQSDMNPLQVDIRSA